VSPALLSAALAGLLCAASACGSKHASEPNGSTNPDTPVPDTACDGGVSADPQITSSSMVANMTRDEFASRCDKRHGIMETQPHCGGSNACRGMSYDLDTQTLIEHTCRATNSCAGYSCVICD
jgi:hypothetical protein